MLSEPRRVDQIFDALSQLHDVDAETMIREVILFLQTLIERRLVRWSIRGGADEGEEYRRILPARGYGHAGCGAACGTLRTARTGLRVGKPSAPTHPPVCACEIGWVSWAVETIGAKHG